ncbi:Flagellar hook-length control protein-like, C-terminal [Rhabdaerophilaceae bacterium]
MQIQEVKAKSLQTLMAVLEGAGAAAPMDATEPNSKSLRTLSQQATILLPPQGNRLTIALPGGPLEVILPEPLLQAYKANPAVFARGQWLLVEIDPRTATLQLTLPELPASTTPATTRSLGSQNPGPSAAPVPPLLTLFPPGTPGAFIQRLAQITLPLGERVPMTPDSAANLPATPHSRAPSGLQAAAVPPGMRPEVIAHMPQPLIDAALRAAIRQSPIAPVLARILENPAQNVKPEHVEALRVLRLDGQLKPDASAIKTSIAQSGLFLERSLSRSAVVMGGPPFAPALAGSGLSAPGPTQAAAQSTAQASVQAAPSGRSQGVPPQPQTVLEKPGAAADHIATLPQPRDIRSPDLKALLGAIRANLPLEPNDLVEPSAQDRPRFAHQPPHSVGRAPDLNAMPVLLRESLLSKEAGAPRSPGALPDKVEQLSQANTRNAVPDRANGQLPATELARLVEGAIERIKLHQIASLPDNPGLVVTDDRAQASRIALQIPLAPQGLERPETAMIGLVIEHEQRPDLPVGLTVEDEGGQNAEAFPWKVRIAVDLEETGPVQAEIALRGQSVAVTLWAERHTMAERARAAIGTLHQALVDASFDVRALDVRDGRPRDSAGPRIPALDRRS